jgi:RNA 2',3'-cyclic 3'-phosphodiesterase
MRAFLALEIPEEVKAYLETTVQTMKSRVQGVKWVGREGQHITLKFFGEIQESLVREIHALLAPIGNRHDAFTGALKEVTAFPSRRRARVIVVALEKGVDNLLRIFHDIEDSLSTIGIQKEERDFIPHVTLGRRKVPGPVLDRDIPELEPRTFSLDRIILFQSRLTREGAVYAPQWDIILGGKVP